MNVGSNVIVDVIKELFISVKEFEKLNYGDDWKDQLINVVELVANCNYVCCVLKAKRTNLSKPLTTKCSLSSLFLFWSNKVEKTNFDNWSWQVIHFNSLPIFMFLLCYGIGFCFYLICNLRVIIIDINIEHEHMMNGVHLDGFPSVTW